MSTRYAMYPAHNKEKTYVLEGVCVAVRLAEAD